MEAAGASGCAVVGSGPPSLSDGEFGAMPVVVVFLVGDAYGESGSGRGGAVEAGRGPPILSDGDAGAPFLEYGEEEP